MARRTTAGEHAFSRIGKVRGRESEGDFAIIVRDDDRTWVARLRPDGTADGATEELVASDSIVDQKSIHRAMLKQRGTLTLPASLRRRYGIGENTPLLIVEEGDDRFTVYPARPAPMHGPWPSLDDLLAGITSENIHAEIDTGPPVGREVL